MKRWIILTTAFAFLGGCILSASCSDKMSGSPNDPVTDCAACDNCHLMGNDYNCNTVSGCASCLLDFGCLVCSEAADQAQGGGGGDSSSSSSKPIDNGVLLVEGVDYVINELTLSPMSDSKQKLTFDFELLKDFSLFYAKFTFHIESSIESSGLQVGIMELDGESCYENAIYTYRHYNKSAYETISGTAKLKLATSSPVICKVQVFGTVQTD